VEILLETVEAPAARREPRVPSRVEFHRDAAGDLRFLGYLSDISATGAFIQCSRPRDIGTQLRVRLHLGRAEHEIIDLDAIIEERIPVLEWLLADRAVIQQDEGVRDEVQLALTDTLATARRLERIDRRVSGVRLASGRFLAAGSVICCAGAWARPPTGSGSWHCNRTW